MIFKKKCKICDKPFESDKRATPCCSDSCKFIFFKNRTVKTIKTCQEKYGVDNPSCVMEFRKKISDAYKNKTNDEKYNIVKKRKLSFIKKYNVDSYSKTPEYKEKVKITNNKNFGVDYPLQSEKGKNKSKQTCNEKYNVDYTGQLNSVYEKRKNTLIDRYGVDNISKSFVHQNKKIKTSRKKYNTDYPMQCEEIFNKSQTKRFTKHDYILPSGKIIKIQGYEFKFLNEYFLLGNREENIIIHPTQNVIGKLWYIFIDDKKHRYYPDFYIPKDNKIIEVKSEYTYNKELTENILKKQSCIDNGYSFEFKIYKISD